MATLTGTFLSTLSLRRATSPAAGKRAGCYHFYPRSPCGERPALKTIKALFDTISIHALLAESDHFSKPHGRTFAISIHALLAESDQYRAGGPGRRPDFYPRSPCGERRYLLPAASRPYYFYPRSPCGERPGRHQKQDGVFCISIHALLAESDT